MLLKIVAVMIFNGLKELYQPTQRCTGYNKTETEDGPINLGRNVFTLRILLYPVHPCFWPSIIKKKSDTPRKCASCLFLRLRFLINSIYLNVPNSNNRQLVFCFNYFLEFLFENKFAYLGELFALKSGWKCR